MHFSRATRVLTASLPLLALPVFLHHLRVCGTQEPLHLVARSVTLVDEQGRTAMELSSNKSGGSIRVLSFDEDAEIDISGTALKCYTPGEYPPVWLGLMNSAGFLALRENGRTAVVLGADEAGSPGGRIDIWDADSRIAATLRGEDGIGRLFLYENTQEPGHYEDLGGGWELTGSEEVPRRRILWHTAWKAQAEETERVWQRAYEAILRYRQQGAESGETVDKDR